LGINFSNNPKVYFWGRGSDAQDESTWLALDGSATSVDGELQSVLTQIPVDYSSPAAPLVQSNPLVNSDGFSMFSGPIKLISNLGAGAESNPASYSVADCRNLSEIPTGMHCCFEGEAEGNLLYETISCPGVPRDGGYVWRFTTGNIPETRQVDVECGKFSPSPSTEWDDGENVCLNAEVLVEFTGQMDETSFAGNVLLYTCGSGDEPESCTQINEFSNNFNASSNILTIRSANLPPGGFGNLQPDTWYHIELLNGVQGFSQEYVLGVLTSFYTPLQRTRSCSDDTAFCFDFKTGPLGTECVLEEVKIRPITYSVSRLGLVLDKRYPVERSGH